MSDLTPGFVYSGSSPSNQVTAQNLNALLGNAVINPTFYTGKPVQTTMATGDQLLLVNPTGGTGGTPAFYTISQQLAITAGVARGGAGGVTNACTDSATVGVTYSSAVLRSAIGPGQSAIFGAGSVTITPLTLSQVVNGRDYAGAVAVSTWHYVYLVSDGTNVYGLVSQSATSPTLPSGISYFCLVGVLKTTATSTVKNYSQLGSSYTWLNISAIGSAVANFDPLTGATPALMDGTAGSGTSIDTANTFQTINLAGCVPPQARRISGFFGCTSNTSGGSFIFGPNVQGTTSSFTATGGLQAYYTLPASASTLFGLGQFQNLEMALMIAQEIWWTCSVAGAGHKDRAFRITGFELSL